MFRKVEKRAIVFSSVIIISRIHFSNFIKKLQLLNAVALNSYLIGRPHFTVYRYHSVRATMTKPKYWIQMHLTESVEFAIISSNYVFSDIRLEIKIE
jgi:hypothetical protein